MNVEKIAIEILATQKKYINDNDLAISCHSLIIVYSAVNILILQGLMDLLTTVS